MADGGHTESSAVVLVSATREGREWFYDVCLDGGFSPQSGLDHRDAAEVIVLLSHGTSRQARRLMREARRTALAAGVPTDR